MKNKPKEHDDQIHKELMHAMQNAHSIKDPKAQKAMENREEIIRDLEQINASKG
ncbi:MAG: hypothetical protein RL609_1661 [Bacteroidota bacterium]|jgi:hypothetical protein